MIIPHWSYPAAPPLLDSVQGIASLSPAPAVKFGCFNFFHVALDYILAQVRKFQISWTLLLRIVNWSHFQFPVVQAFNPAEERRREEISGVRPPILTVIETSPLIKMIHLVNICPRRKYFLFLGNFLSHKVFLLWKKIFSVQRERQRYFGKIFSVCRGSCKDIYCSQIGSTVPGTLINAIISSWTTKTKRRRN